MRWACIRRRIFLPPAPAPGPVLLELHSFAAPALSLLVIAFRAQAVAVCGLRGGRMNGGPAPTPPILKEETPWPMPISPPIHTRSSRAGGPGGTGADPPAYPTGDGLPRPRQQGPGVVAEDDQEGAPQPGGPSAIPAPERNSPRCRPCAHVCPFPGRGGIRTPPTT